MNVCQKLSDSYLGCSLQETFRIKEIAHNIIYTINQLLRTSSPENIKCICLTLKVRDDFLSLLAQSFQWIPFLSIQLCGYELEMDFPDDVREIMAKLNQKVNNVDVGTSRILETVLLLQKNNWGHTEAASKWKLFFTQLKWHWHWTMLQISHLLLTKVQPAIVVYRSFMDPMGK